MKKTVFNIETGNQTLIDLTQEEIDAINDQPAPEPAPEPAGIIEIRYVGNKAAMLKKKFELVMTDTGLGVREKE